MRDRLTIVLLVGVLLTACEGQASAVPHEPLRVEYAFWWGDFTLLVAKENGFFEKQGVAVEPVYYENFPQAPADLAAGKIDAGLFSIGDALVASEHTAVTVIAAYDDGGLNTIVAAPEILSIADLKGKRIGVKIGSPYEIFVREMLHTSGLEISDVILVNMTAEEVAQAMPRGEVQAGFVWEPYTTELLSQRNHVLFSSAQISSLYPDLIVFRSAVVKERPAEVRAFLKAWFEAVAYREAHVEETREIAAKYLSVDPQAIQVDTQLQIMTLEDNLRMFERTPPDGSRSIYDTAQISVDFLIGIGTLSKQPALETILDGLFLK